MMKRNIILESKRIAEIGFMQKPYSFTDGGSVGNGVEFFPKVGLNKVPMLTGEDLTVYEEHNRLKCTFKMIIHNVQELPKIFHPCANVIKMHFNNDYDDGFAFIDFCNIDMVDLSEPEKFEDNKMFIYVRFVMKGFEEANRFIQISPEMQNWYKMFGVEITRCMNPPIAIKN